MTDAEKQRLEEIEADLKEYRAEITNSYSINWLIDLIHRQRAMLTMARGALDAADEAFDGTFAYFRDTPLGVKLASTVAQLDSIAKAEAVVEAYCHHDEYAGWVCGEDAYLNWSNKGILIVLPKESEHEQE